MSRQVVSTEQRRELCDAEVILNGHRAKVSGVRMPYASVTDLSTGLSAEWAWPTVALVVARGGAFKS